VLDPRSQAILAWALGQCRAQLYGCLSGDHDQVKSVLAATSLASLAARIGRSEADLAIDCAEYLTPDERLLIPEDDGPTRQGA
jgi:hypothetical protein